jgi:hypothetical protein
MVIVAVIVAIVPAVTFGLPDDPADADGFDTFAKAASHIHGDLARDRVLVVVTGERDHALLR